MTKKIIVFTLLIAAFTGSAIGEDWRRQQAIEAKHRQSELCHQYYDYHRGMYLETRDVKYLRRLQNPVEDVALCKEFFEGRLNER